MHWIRMQRHSEKQPANRMHIKTGSREITRYTIAGRHVYLLKMRAGAVESAISAEALLGKFPCSMIFCLGPAGGIADTIATGSWFRVAGVVAYQRGSWGSADLRWRLERRTR